MFNLRSTFKLRSIRLKYLLLGNNNFKFSIDSQVETNHAKFKKSIINILDQSKLQIGKNCKINHSTINIKNGTLIISDNVSLINATIEINNGNVLIANNARIMCRIWVRYGGNIRIGEYTNINTGSELRSDESIVIGDFTRVSYNVSIWDTNTHYIYSPSKRREISKSIGVGNEIEKPYTNPVIIGNDCWIGKNSAIMKGTKIGNNVIVGYGTTLVKQIIDDNVTVVPQLTFKIKKNNNI